MGNKLEVSEDILYAAFKCLLEGSEYDWEHLSEEQWKEVSGLLDKMTENRYGPK